MCKALGWVGVGVKPIKDHANANNIGAYQVTGVWCIHRPTENLKVPGPTGRGSPVATGGYGSVVCTAKLNSTQEGGGLDHRKLEHTTPERDIEFEVCLMPDPGDVGAIAAWLQERFPINPRGPYPRSWPLAACNIREMAARFRGLWCDQDELYGSRRRRRQRSRCPRPRRAGARPPRGAPRTAASGDQLPITR